MPDVSPADATWDQAWGIFFLVCNTVTIPVSVLVSWVSLFVKYGM